ncbi:hypothetical protein PSH76_08630 [Pseudomonas sp. FP215]|uniref:hypothetical protein n=1 Tax=Pseudomonas sp. FP215 TaxID=2738126 RepID=UPI002734793E|nr:hypothetical protein [Pseudomonas sp. FP215]WLH25884.1 hypothetical protein PSH76_08630 [Pseudomonas sp. FP215]
MNVDMDTDDWLGCPTPLEMYQHQCALLVDELVETERMLHRARANIAGLVQMNDLLMTGKAEAEEKLRNAEDELSRVNVEYSERGKEIMSLKMISSQNEHLRRENQRLLLELTSLRAPQP